MPLSWPDKDPDEILDYSIDWSARLGEDEISGSTWTLPDGLTAGLDYVETGSTRIFISGGTAGTRYKVQNRITTTGGRTLEESVTLRVVDR